MKYFKISDFLKTLDPVLTYDTALQEFLLSNKN